RLHDEADDLRAARRADDEPDPVAVVEHERRRHRAQRPLAALDAIRDRLSAAFGLVVEVVELVVQDEAAGHELAAERALNARRQRHGVAVSVDDREVAPRRPFPRDPRRAAPGRDARRRSALTVGAKFQAATPAGAPGFTAGSARFKSIADARVST